MDDAFQDCVINLLGKQIPKEYSDAFVSKCFINFGIDVSRKKQTSQSHISIGLEDSAYNYIYEDENTETKFEHLLDENINVSQFVNNLLSTSNLSELRKNVLQLYYFEGKKFKEIAKILNTSEVTCRTSSFNSLRILHEQIKSKAIGRKSNTPKEKNY